MTSVFAFPIAFLAGAVALGALAVIYLFRNRLPTVEISGLFLWADAPRTREGGRKLKRPATPWSLLLEILALVLLALAAARPLIESKGDARPLVVVLDDSFSMRAGGDDSARSRAIRFAKSELGGGGVSSVSFVLAGPLPTLAGRASGNTTDGTRALDSWACGAASSDLDSAIALAMETEGPKAKILVLTDHAPANPPAAGRVVWRAFGTPMPNVAFTAALRSSSGGSDRVAFDVTAFSEAPIRAKLTVSGEAGATSTQRELDLGPRETKRVSLQLPESVAEVVARLDGDSVAFDNEVSLLRAKRDDVRVELTLSDPQLEALFTEALEATGRARLTNLDPDLVIADAAAPRVPRAGSWAVAVESGAGAVALAGPFMTDESHPLMEGVSLTGTIWGASRGPMNGDPVIFAGNTPLVTDSADGSGGHLLRVRFVPRLSTLHQTPAWPIFIWNLVDWRARSLPGFRDANVRLGTIAELSAPPGVERVTIESPGGQRRETTVTDGRVGVLASAPGIWVARSKAKSWTLSVIPVAPDESDLANASTGSWGSWRQESSGDGRRDLSWLAALLALGILAAHLRHVTREGEA